MISGQSGQGWEGTGPSAASCSRERSEMWSGGILYSFFYNKSASSDVGQRGVGRGTSRGLPGYGAQGPDGQVKFSPGIIA